MKIAILVAALFALSIDMAAAAGLERIVVRSPIANSGTLEGAVWYPCAETPKIVKFRGVELAGVPDCDVAGTSLPLIVISHGARGWFGGHHDTAAALADAGYVVAAITHPDKGRSWQTNRPAEIKGLIDYMLEGWGARSRLDADRIGFFGFSRGAYTGLVSIGGVPKFRKLILHCLFAWSDPMCKSPDESGSSDEPVVKVDGFTHDPRIKAAVIAAPIGMVFSGDGLSEITAPVQLWRAERDELLIHPNHAEVVYEALPAKPEYHVVPKAGHFAFLAPCNDVQFAAAKFICEDAPGFDRVQFHADMNAQIARFFDLRLDPQ